MRVGIVMEEVRRHRVHHGLGHLRAAGTVEIGDRPAGMHALQCREHGANRVDWRDCGHAPSRASRIGWIALGSAFPRTLLHHLPDKEPGQLGLTAAEPGNLGRMRSHHFIDPADECVRVTNLDQSESLGDGKRRVGRGAELGVDPLGGLQ